MKRSLVVLSSVTALALGVTLGFAQNLDIIKLRRETMRTVLDANVRNYRMITEKDPFDLAAAQAGLKTFIELAPKYKSMFPDDSKTGGGTDASPKIWQARAEFDGAIDKWVADTTAALAVIKDEASFKAEYPKVAADCGNCHKAADGFTLRLGDSIRKPKP